MTVPRRTAPATPVTRAVAPVRELWVIDDDPMCRRALARSLRAAAPDLEVHAFARIDEADAALEHRTPAGVLVDERLGDTSGHAWIAARRALLGDAHVVLCTGFAGPAASEHAYLAADALLIKPVTHAAVRLFVDRASAPRTDPLHAALTSWCRRSRLSPTQSAIVALLANGVSRDEIGVRLGVAPNTIKHHIKAILKKSELHSIPAVVASILQQVRLAS